MTAGRALLLSASALTACLDAPPSATSGPHSLQFFGSPYRENGVDRAWIAADAPSPVGRIGKNDFTVELWLKVDAVDIAPFEGCPSAWFEGTILLDRGFYNGPQDGDIGIGVYRSGSVSGVVASFGVDIGRTTACGDTQIGDGRWHHVAFTRGADDVISLWVDGMLDDMLQGPAGDGSYADTLVDPLEGDLFMVLGGPKYVEDISDGFAGRIDDVRLSNDDRYVEPFDPPYPPLEVDDNTLALYTFDEEQGIELANATGGAGNGQLRLGGDPAAPMWSDDVPRP